MRQVIKVIPCGFNRHLNDLSVDEGVGRQVELDPVSGLLPMASGSHEESFGPAQPEKEAAVGFRGSADLMQAAGDVQADLAPAKLSLIFNWLISS